MTAVEEEWTEESYDEDEEVIEIIEEECETSRGLSPLSPKEEEQVTRFRKMSKMGIPEGAVRIKMGSEGCSRRVFEAVADLHNSQSISRDVAPPKAHRTAHSLFGNDDAKTMLLEAVTSMKRKQSTPSPALAPTTAPVSENSRIALDEHIKALALKMSTGSAASASKPDVVKHNQFPPKASSNSLSEQVALLAANRAKRLAGEDVPGGLVKELTDPTPRTSGQPPKARDNPVRVITRQRAVSNTPMRRATSSSSSSSSSSVPAPVVTKLPASSESPKKTALKTTSKAVTATTPAPALKVIREPTSVTKTVTTTNKNASPQSDGFVQSDLLKTSPSTTNDNDQHDFQKLKLESVNKEDGPPTTTRATAIAATTLSTTTSTGAPSETVVTKVVTITPGEDGTRTVTRTTTTTKTVKRVTKGEPTYEVTEYKCGCSTM